MSTDELLTSIRIFHIIYLHKRRISSNATRRDQHDPLCSFEPLPLTVQVYTCFEHDAGVPHNVRHRAEIWLEGKQACAG
jgi:hypothetical protein